MKRVSDTAIGGVVLISGVGVFALALLLLLSGDPARWLWIAAGAVGALMVRAGVDTLSE